MDAMLYWIMCFAEDEKGTTAIEYALVAGLVSILIVAAATGIGTSLNVLFTAVAAGVAIAAS
jgi:pilus assembly protein Flp/PilA